MKTETITRYASNEYIRKNNLDADSRVHLPEHMKKMFMGYPEYIEPLRWDFDSTIAYKEVYDNEIRTRPITQEEFESLDPSQKKLSKRLDYVGLAICAILDVVLIILFIKNLSILDKKGYFSYGILFLVFIFIAFLVVHDTKKSIIKPDSQIAEGNAVLLDKSDYNDSVIYSVMVAFHDQESYITCIRCCERDYNMMSVGSKVYVKVEGSSAIAYAVK